MTQVIGHRGIAGLEPENTLRSFRRAIALGVDYVECDVRLSADAQPVLVHDETVDRTTDGTGRVAKLPLAALRQLDAGEGQRVPTFAELLDLLRHRCKAHIELKAPGTEAIVLEMVEEWDLLDDVVLTSGDTERLNAVRDLSPEVAIEHIFAQPPPDAIERALYVGAQRLSVHHRHATSDYIGAAHAAGLEVVVWPPNTEAEMEAMIDLGADLVCTDRPDILLRLLGR
ncbi:MAG: glycerophosphodiester phosphodiesterase [Candidatus Brocadiia bacterium]